MMHSMCLKGVPFRGSGNRVTGDEIGEVARNLPSPRGITTQVSDSLPHAIIAIPAVGKLQIVDAM